MEIALFLCPWVHYSIYVHGCGAVAIRLKLISYNRLLIILNGLYVLWGRLFAIEPVQFQI
jgi:hypothetical protein